MTCAKMCSFVMHRGLIIANIQFYFMVTFFFVDMPIFNGMLIFGYSTIYTSLPVISMIKDEDLTFEKVKQYPILYRELQRGRYLNMKSFFVIVMKSTFQGAIIILLTVILFPSSTLDIVTICFTSLIVTELLNTVSLVSRFTFGLFVTVGLSVLIYLFSIIYFSEYISIKNIDEEFARKIMYIVLASWGFIFVCEVIEGCIWPSFTKQVLSGQPPVVYDKIYNEKGEEKYEVFEFENDRDDVMEHDSRKRNARENEPLLY